MKKKYIMTQIMLIFFALMLIIPNMVSANNINFIIQQMEENYRNQMLANFMTLTL